MRGLQARHEENGQKKEARIGPKMRKRIGKCPSFVVLHFNHCRHIEGIDSRDSYKPVFSY